MARWIGLLVIATLALTASLPTKGQAPLQCRGAFPATGQTTCWDSNGAVIPCAGTGQDGELQTGAPLAYVDNGDGTITDENSCLTWEKLSADGSIHDTTPDYGFYTWDEVFAKVARLNNMRFAGYTGWRLPNVRELLSLTNYETAVSSEFNNGCIPGCTVGTCSCGGGNYWSSTTLAGSPDHAWFLSVGAGDAWVAHKTINRLGRAVRRGDQIVARSRSNCRAVLATGQTTCWDSNGAVIPCSGTGQDGELQTGAPLAYVDNGDGTITDTNTCLTWEKLTGDGSIHDTIGGHSYSWEQAFTKIAQLNAASFAGHTDWRLPNVRELLSLLDYQQAPPAFSPAFNNGCVPGCTSSTCSCTGSGEYWSSTTFVGEPHAAWVLSDYFVWLRPKPSSGLVRAVRGGAPQAGLTVQALGPGISEFVFRGKPRSRS